MQPGRTWSSRFTSDRLLWTTPQRDATSHLDIKLRYLDNVTTDMTPSTPERQPHGKRTINQNRPPRKRNPVVPGHHDSLRIDRFGPHRNVTQLRTWTSNCDAWTMSPQTWHSRMKGFCGQKPVWLSYSSVRLDKRPMVSDGSE